MRYNLYTLWLFSAFMQSQLWLLLYVHTVNYRCAKLNHILKAFFTCHCKALPTLSMGG